MEKRLLDYWIMALEVYKLHRRVFGVAALHDFQTYKVFDMLSANRGRFEGLSGSDLAKRVTEFIEEAKKQPKTAGGTKKSAKSKANS